VWGSGLAEEQVEHPAAPDVRTRPPAMGQDVRVRTTGLFESIGQDGEVLELAALVDGLGECEDGGIDRMAIVQLDLSRPPCCAAEQDDLRAVRCRPRGWTGRLTVGPGPADIDANDSDFLSCR
jgi:hypothetical protein